MTPNNYPEGLDELALQAAISSEIQSEWFMGDYKVGAECFARALLDAHQRGRRKGMEEAAKIANEHEGVAWAVSAIRNRKAELEKSNG